MSFVKQLPKGLSYFVRQEAGKVESTLDMTRTEICVVPEGLRGVDNVKVNWWQLSYVSPDFKGRVLVCNALDDRPVVASKEEMKKWRDAYVLAKEESPMWFDMSVMSPRNNETMLVSGLRFNRATRILNAHHTTLLEYTPVAGVLGTLMPDPAIARKKLRIKRHKRYKLNSDAKRKDPGYIRAVCHRHTATNTQPDRYV